MQLLYIYDISYINQSLEFFFICRGPLSWEKKGVQYEIRSKK